MKIRQHARTLITTVRGLKEKKEKRKTAPASGACLLLYKAYCGIQNLFGKCVNITLCSVQLFSNAGELSDNINSITVSHCLSV